MILDNSIEYFPIASDVPAGVSAIQDAPCNVNKHIYELSLSLFTDCNLHCSFCFQNDVRSCCATTFDKQYILSIPSVVHETVSKKLKEYGTKTLYVRIWGGELFQDKFENDVFDTYKQLCDSLVNAFAHTDPDVNVVFNFMTNGIWEKNFSRILDLAQHVHGYIGFSYDPVGRYASRQLQMRAIQNIKNIKRELGYTNVATTLTAPNIKSIISSTDPLYADGEFLPSIALETNMYIPNKDWKQNLPTGGQVFQFYKHCIDEKLFMFSSIVNYVKAEFGLCPRRRSTCCDCKASLQYSNGKIINDCVAKSTCLSLDKFYGKHSSMLSDSNCHDIKQFLALSKRKCLMCRYYDICPGFCSASILFNEYIEHECPIALTFKYIKDNTSRVRHDFDCYCSQHVLPEKMLSMLK